MAEGDTVETPLQVGDEVPWAPTNDLGEHHDDIAGEAAEVSDPTSLITEAAFLVYLDPNGHWTADSEKVNIPVSAARPAHLGDIRHAVAEIDQDLLAIAIAQRTAPAVLQMQQQMMMQAQKQMEAQRIAAGLAGGAPGAVDMNELTRRLKRG